MQQEMCARWTKHLSLAASGRGFLLALREAVSTRAGATGDCEWPLGIGLAYIYKARG